MMVLVMNLAANVTYDPLAETLTGGVKQAIFTFNIYIPLLLFAVMFVLSLKFDLDKKIPQIHEELEKRKK